MPVYEYVCNDCEKVTEALRKMADADASQPCEHCGSVKTHRTQSLVAVNTGGSRSESLPMQGGCGRCGDPRGSCEM